ncbi:MAG TPA: hypothetical protein VFF67_03290 [Thermoplasmata archaeon]|nr:hypothetical protein [Thermoplasmata archaeon]
MALKQKTAPYAGTEIPPERSRQLIDKLLRRYGVDAVVWSEVWAKNRVLLEFVVQLDDGRAVKVRLEPPAFAAKRKSYNSTTGHYELVDAPNWAQSYRLLYYYLKTKLESVVYGLRDIEEEFLSDLVVRDKTGRETTVGEIARAQLASGELRPAIEGPREPVDAEFQGVGA